VANILGNRIRLLRKSSGLNQRQLAQELNISNTTLSQYENAQRVPSDEVKLSIAKFFDVSIDYLLGASNEKNHYSKSDNIDSFISSLDIDALDENSRKALENYVNLLKLKQKAEANMKADNSSSTSNGTA
jgi:transcriptional regulator with XRE-family HTH domain